MKILHRISTHRRGPLRLLSTSSRFSARFRYSIPQTLRLTASYTLRATVTILVLAPVLPLSIRSISGASMSPTLSSDPTDYLIFKTLLPGELTTLDSSTPPPRDLHNVISRGCLVLLSSPLDPQKYVVKRVVGLPSDRIRRLRRKGKGVEEEIEVPYGHLWVEGDNEDDSLDSNEYGPVSMGLVAEVAYGRAGWPWRGWPERKWKRWDWEADGWERRVGERLKRREDNKGWKGEEVPEGWRMFREGDVE